MTQILRRIDVAVVALGLLLGVAARPANAALILMMEEVGGDVVVSGSGTADLSALAGPVFGNQLVAMEPSTPTLVLGLPPGGDVDFYSGLSGPASFGPGDDTAASSGMGDHFGVDFLRLVVPLGYSSGDPLSGTSVYAGATLASLGVIPGTYVWTWGTGANADLLTLQIGPAAVPEPVSLSLLAVGVAGLGVRRWRPRTG